MGRLIVNNSLAEVKTVFLVANIVYCVLISTKYESTTSTEKHAPNKPEVPLWRDTTSLRHTNPKLFQKIIRIRMQITTRGCGQLNQGELCGKSWENNKHQGSDADSKHRQCKPDNKSC